MHTSRWSIAIFAAMLSLAPFTQIRAQASDEPSKDEFIDIDHEPQPIMPIEKLVRYPEVARRSGLEGKVTLEALIDTSGSVRKVEVLKSDYDIFKDEAVRAMKESRYTPAMSGNKKVMVWVTRTINFKLTEPLTLPSLVGNDIETIRSFFAKFGTPQQVIESGEKYLRVSTPDSLSHGGLPAQMEALIEQDEATEVTLIYRGLSEADYARISRADFSDVTLHENAHDFDIGSYAIGRVEADPAKRNVRITIWKK